MFSPSWKGVIDWKKGLYYSNTNHINQNIDNIITKNTKTIDNIDNVNNINNVDNVETNKFNFIDSAIPYYNINLEYLKNETNNQNKYNANYYNLLDRIGNISRYLLKGNDYYKLYISKNANKYFTHETDDDINNYQNTNKNINENEPIQNKLFNNLINKNNKNMISYQEIEKPIQQNDDSDIEE
jgi:hypothetical protein